MDGKVSRVLNYPSRKTEFTLNVNSLVALPVHACNDRKRKSIEPLPTPHQVEQFINYFDDVATKNKKKIFEEPACVISSSNSLVPLTQRCQYVKARCYVRVDATRTR